MLARSWSGHWDPVALESLRTMIARCTRKQIEAVLGHIGRIIRSMTSDCWRHLVATTAQPFSCSSPHSFTPGGSIDEHHRLRPSPKRGPRLNTEFPYPCFVRLLTELAIQRSGAEGGYSVFYFTYVSNGVVVLFVVITLCLFPVLVLYCFVLAYVLHN